MDIDRTPYSVYCLFLHEAVFHAFHAWKDHSDNVTLVGFYLLPLTNFR